MWLWLTSFVRCNDKFSLSVHVNRNSFLLFTIWRVPTHSITKVAGNLLSNCHNKLGSFPLWERYDLFQIKSWEPEQLTVAVESSGPLFWTPGEFQGQCPNTGPKDKPLAL